MNEVLFPMMTGDASEPGVLATWYVADGDAVAEKHLLAEVAIDKVDAEIYAPVAGTVRLRVQEGDEVAQGAVIAVIE
ncbi:pyruvate/2-oxoglutarate dehydrogenase complex dihydrolipoamide acyltransferase (E2) component [Arthrobacter silviterrae]|uniref:Biotin attachment protein n=1 Tax=Arthrobacter silviterrae TaxID=2026658 RepID=A0ABX0DBY5_9MICC|nr:MULTISPECIES: lipoyl domain-containing protein [Arthrobacter]MCU6480920.1 lipoyl domain-containing protein [Arthrobacter sp. A2-55]MDQ0279016.1 pyruvate/2-oxoglutarate dehydrogenase complex dihydrolipoamide acyltransferase (E2) component [Arthrobacter silviterrae]NGN84434.1 biotin attachment protein [Arthrobacter silviterrae]